MIFVIIALIMLAIISSAFLYNREEKSDILLSIVMSVIFGAGIFIGYHW